MVIRECRRHAGKTSGCGDQRQNNLLHFSILEVREKASRHRSKPALRFPSICVPCNAFRASFTGRFVAGRGIRLRVQRDSSVLRRCNARDPTDVQEKARGVSGNMPTARCESCELDRLVRALRNQHLSRTAHSPQPDLHRVMHAHTVAGLAVARLQARLELDDYYSGATARDDFASRLRMHYVRYAPACEPWLRRIDKIDPAWRFSIDHVSRARRQRHWGIHL